MFQRKTNNDLEYLLEKLNKLESKLNDIEAKLNNIYELISHSSSDSITNKIHQWIQTNEILKK
jgi:hypothetical protein